MLTEDEIKRVEIIKQDLPTRNKWSKQDYSDFYYRDVILLLAIIDRKILQQKDSVDIPDCTCKWGAITSDLMCPVHGPK